eukprot:m.489027 g.489027  ORF g.489027 m.489027 type:complete len:297 (+) comp26329_c0_seq1:1078-1968(+)
MTAGCVCAHARAPNKGASFPDTFVHSVPNQLQSAGQWKAWCCKQAGETLAKARITQVAWDPDCPDTAPVETVLCEPEASVADVQELTASEDTVSNEPLQPSEVIVLAKLCTHLEQQLADATTALRGLSCLMLLTTAANQSRTVRRHLKHEVLPRRVDFSVAPEKGPGLGPAVLRQMTAASLPLSNAASDFVYALCNHNASRVVRRAGYGNAAGLFARVGISGMPAHENDSDTDSDDLDDDVDVVTGTRQPARPARRREDMSEEEKERSAAELMHLIGQLNAQGIISCQLPEPKGED